MKKIWILLAGIATVVTLNSVAPTYKWHVEIMNPQATWQPPKRLQQEADKIFGTLHLTPYFERSLLLNLPAMRELWHTDKSLRASQHTVAFRHDDLEQYISLDCTFFDRNADQLLIIAPGFTNPHQVLAPFVPMFPTFDVVLMDFRGHALQEEGSWLNPCSWTFDPIKKFFSIDLSQVSFGKHEHLDVWQVAKHFARKKDYRQVCGLGICYGAFILVEAAALYPDLFDKLVIDGCWSNLQDFVNTIRQSPGVVINPQRGAEVPTCCLPTSTAVNIAETLLSWWGMKLPENLSLIPFAQALQTPILMFHGKDDLTVSREQFETLFNAFGTPHKTAVITGNPHVRNHLYDTRELYALLCNEFFAAKSKESWWHVAGEQHKNFAHALTLKAYELQ